MYFGSGSGQSPLDYDDEDEVDSIDNQDHISTGTIRIRKWIHYDGTVEITYGDQHVVIKKDDC